MHTHRYWTCLAGSGALLLCLATAFADTPLSFSFGPQQPPDAQLPSNPQHLSRDGYERVTTLRQAVAVLRHQLNQDGKPEYAGLITEDRMRQAILTALASTELQMEEIQQRSPDFMLSFYNVTRPIARRIAERGEWPPGCHFWGFYRLTDSNQGRDVAYDGLGLRLRMVQADTTTDLPVLDLYYGRLPRLCDWGEVGKPAHQPLTPHPASNTPLECCRESVRRVRWRGRHRV